MAHRLHAFSEQAENQLRFRGLGFAIATALALTPGRAEAIPAFARRYGLDCMFCHNVFPKLNTAGQRFKERGYRLEREDAFVLKDWAKSVPVVGHGVVERSIVEGSPGAFAGHIHGISAGNLGDRFSYWVDDELDFGGSVFLAKPDNAYLRFEVVKDGKLYVRAGRLELDLPFSQTRNPHLFGYDIYYAFAGQETESLGAHKDGIEVGGDLRRGARWSAAVVKGLDEGPPGSPRNLFLRVSQREGGNRFGAFAYIGASKLSVPYPAPLIWDDNLLRLGLDADLWVSRLNIYGVYLYGRNSNSIATAAAPGGTRQPLTFTGGFAQADWHLFSVAALTLRLDLVRGPPPPTNGANQTATTVYPGLQVILLEHGKFSFEYGFSNHGLPGVGSAQLEVAF